MSKPAKSTPTTRRTLLGAAAVSLAACAKDSVDPSSSPTSHPSRSATPSLSSPSQSSASGAEGSQSPDPSPTPSSNASTCDDFAASLPLATRCGQLLMAGITDPRLDPAHLASLGAQQVGFALILGTQITGRADVSVLSSQLSGVNPKLPLVIAVDQEGGRVQRLQGEGFSTIPSAVEQATLGRAELQAKWKTWAAELARVGVLWNLAPCADVVPADKLSSNAPIGQLKRNYGTSGPQALKGVVAANAGMLAGGVATSLKHFPGLGQVTTNTDFGQATDTVTTADSPDLTSFTGAIEAGVSSVMVSSAVYTKIDPDHRAVFSRVIITDLLRTKLGFTGVVVSDDLGAAESVAEVPAAERATRFIDAGGDVVICADPAKVKPMIDGLIAKAGSDKAFEAKVTAACARVLALKASVKVPGSVDWACS